MDSCSVDNSDKLTKPCSICCKEALTKCQKCQSIVYCGKKCQRAGWKKHKRICFTIEKKRKTLNNETIRLESINLFKTAIGSFHKLEVSVVNIIICLIQLLTNKEESN